MRSAGLTIEALIEYVTLYQQGDETIQARKDLLIEQRRLLLERIAEMQATVERLDGKIEAVRPVEPTFQSTASTEQQ